MKFSEVLAKLSNAFLNDIGKSNIFIFMPSLKLFHPWEQRGKYVIKIDCSRGSLSYNILFCKSGLSDWVAVEFKIQC